MIQQVTKAEVLGMVATLVAGIFANPAMAAMASEQFSRQQIMQDTLRDVQNMFLGCGVEILD